MRAYAVYLVMFLPSLNAHRCQTGRRISAAHPGCSFSLNISLDTGQRLAPSQPPAPDHMADNLVAGEGRLPDAAELKKMADYFDVL